MGGSRIAWAGSTVAPWGIALGLLVSITAQAGEDLGGGGGQIARNGANRLSPAREALDAAAFRPIGADPLLIPARLAIGAPEDLNAVADEIEPNKTLKAARAGFPVVERERKGDPFIVLRPGLDARARPQAEVASRDDEVDWPEESRSPARPGAEARPPLAFSDGATPGIALEAALASSTPTPSDGKLRIATAKPAPVTVAAKFEVDAKPNYAAFIDAKDSPRQMRCLAEAVYFESRSEPEAGQAAVAQVVLNRVRSGIFPTDVCGVVYQDRNRPFACQFSFACEGKSLRIEEPGAWAVATRIADEVVKGVNYNPKLVEALNYHATYVYPFWAPSLKRVDKIGMHVFYQMRVGLNWAPGALNGRGDLPPLQQASAK